MNFDGYNPGSFFDEFFESSGKPRPWVEPLIQRINTLPPNGLLNRQKAAESALMQLGITFNVYKESEGVEKIFPFDIIPRIIDGATWNIMEKGLTQRIYALNLFVDDIYHDQKILKDKIIPREIIESCASFLPQCMGLNPPKGIWCHISGIDLITGDQGQLMVLEDNLRCPSGVSYVLGNRQILKQTFPKVFEVMPIRPIEDYTSRLLDLLYYLSPESVPEPSSVVLTPGIYNSAYFEHSYLAQRMGEELVEGRDLVVHEGCVYMQTTRGLLKVDTIYRRVDDDFLDPEAFRPDSALGVPGLMEVYKAGRVALVNAPGVGIADDKLIYTYVPEIIKYYLGEEALLPNVPTYRCVDEKDRSYVLANLDKLVVKAVGQSGGYGMLMGHQSSARERKSFANKINATPRDYIAQPIVSLSRAPVIARNRFEPRHVDFRPFILYGKEIFVLPGGLTRVALKKGSLVVNSSQGGGSKDTWVLYPQNY
ncbi:MAG: hypothetical protein NPINA01_09910 [Nitrospinaceae bacterium]|nr:MAG: hypothetical protein NPINA01_09910 [Nitrospinaceae bacterium]